MRTKREEWSAPESTANGITYSVPRRIAETTNRRDDDSPSLRYFISTVTMKKW